MFRKLFQPYFEITACEISIIVQYSMLHSVYFFIIIT